MTKITINYLDRAGRVVAIHATTDEYTPAGVAAWAATLNDTSCEHPGALEGWDQFEVVAS